MVAWVCVFLFSKSTFLRCSLINDRWYPCFTKLSFICLKLIFKFTWVELIRLIQMTWLQGLWVVRLDVKLALLINFFSVCVICLCVDIFQFLGMIDLSLIYLKYVNDSPSINRYMCFAKNGPWMYLRRMVHR